jgi:ribonuclease M5
MIREVIIVEGRDDISAVKRAVHAEVIATDGFAISPPTWALIHRAAQHAGVIILTDPDAAGRQIRDRVHAALLAPDAASSASPRPVIKHAHVPRHLAQRASDRAVGIEYASPDAIRDALALARCEHAPPPDPLFCAQDLLDHHLNAHPNAHARRAALGAALGLGAPNARQLLIRLNLYGVSRDEFFNALASLPH